MAEDENVSALLSELSIREREKSKSSSGTGLVYDERMKAHCCESFAHPECPERISRIWEKLVENGLVSRCQQVPARDVTEEEVLLVHTKSHYDDMAASVNMPIEKLFHICLSQYNSVYMNQSSFPCAMLSAGSVCEVTRRVVTGELESAIAVVRPPGHHAESKKPMGFCIFNNVAIAAKMAIENHGVQRILIVDWDVHHGNSTQHMFYDDNRVLYVSLHRYDNGRFYPGSSDADYDRIGNPGKAQGFNINIPWNDGRMGDAEYIFAFHQIVLPVAYEYMPDLVIISCGFDSGIGDPLGGYAITPEGYAQMTHLLRGLANGKIVVALEGGYNLTTISDSMCAVAKVLVGEVPPTLDQPCIPCSSAMKTVTKVAQTLAPHWKSLGHWSAEGQMPELPVKECAPETEDSEAQLHVINSAPTTLLGRTEPPPEPTPHPETPPPGSVPLGADRVPLNPKQEAIIQTLEDSGNTVMFAVTPKAWCEHLASVQPLPPDGLDTSAVCQICSTPREDWVCLTCFHVYCGRYINEHMVEHSKEKSHHIVLSYADLSVWCFACDSYLHNPVLFKYIDAASRNKFAD